MDDAPHAGLLGSADQGFGVRNRLLMRGAAEGKSHPISVVEGGGALQALGQLSRVGEIEGRRFNVAAAITTRAVGERLDAFTSVQQARGNVLSRVAERAGDDVKGGLRHR